MEKSEGTAASNAISYISELLICSLIFNRTPTYQALMHIHLCRVRCGTNKQIELGFANACGGIRCAAAELINPAHCRLCLSADLHCCPLWWFNDALKQGCSTVWG